MAFTSSRDDVAILRRRAAQLESNPEYGAGFAAVLLRVADELRVRRRLSDGDENYAVELLADNRGLRLAVHEALAAVMAWPDLPISAMTVRERLAKAARTAARPIYQHRAILVVDCEGRTRAAVEETVKAALDLHYNHGPVAQGDGDHGIEGGYVED